MAALSHYLENKLIDHIFRNQAYTPTTAVYVALLTVSPTKAGGGTEVPLTNAYGRVLVSTSLSAFSGTHGAGTTAVSSGTTGVTSNNGLISFQNPTPSGWGIVTHWALYDAVIDGNLLLFAPLSVANLVSQGNLISFPVGSLRVEIDNRV